MGDDVKSTKLTLEGRKAMQKMHGLSRLSVLFKTNWLK